jgi:periplasmic protein TonB
MNDPEQFDYREKRGFGARYGFVIGILLVVAVGVLLFNKMLSGPKAPPPRPQQELVMIKPPPPPTTPPPPPPPPQEAPREQMMEQSPLDNEETKPEPAEAPSPSLATGIQGSGPADGFGLGSKGGGFLSGGGNGSRSGASRFGWYATQVIKSLSAALSQHQRTRNATFSVKVRIWPDLTGRITRAKLAESTGDPALDEALKNEILIGFQLQEAPPDGMPLPIVMRLTARRPN